MDATTGEGEGKLDVHLLRYLPALDDDDNVVRLLGQVLREDLESLRNQRKAAVAAMRQVKKEKK